MAIKTLHNMRLILTVVLGLLLQVVHPAHADEKRELPQYVIDAFGKPPLVPQGPVADNIKSALKTAILDVAADPKWGPDQEAALQTLAASNDPRMAWVISDLLRFVTNGTLNDTLAGAAAELLGKDLGKQAHWGGRHGSSDGLGHPRATRIFDV